MKIAQISDIHLTEHGQVIWDTDTLSHFESAIQGLSKIKDLDAIIVSGDLSNDDSEWTYHYIDERLATLKLPVFCCLGNHDSTSALSIDFKCLRFDREAMIGEWRFLFINSVSRDPDKLGFFKSRGLILDDDLALLESKIHTGIKTSVVLHHPPIEPGGWLNRKPLENKEVFNDIIRESDVKLVLYGHIHCAQQNNQSEILYSSAPAIGFAYDKDLPKYQIADGQEGISILEFGKEIMIHTELLPFTTKIEFA